MVLHTGQVKVHLLLRTVLDQSQPSYQDQAIFCPALHASTVISGPIIPSIVLLTILQNCATSTSVT